MIRYKPKNSPSNYIYLEPFIHAYQYTTCTNDVYQSRYSLPLCEFVMLKELMN